MGHFFLSSHQSQKHVPIGNSVGTIVDDKLLLYQYSTIISTKIDHLTKVCFYKKRNYFLNFLFFILAIVFAFAILDRDITFFEYMILLGCYICTIILTLSIKQMKYTFLVVRFNLTFTEIKVKGKQKKDAEELVELINVKLKARKDSSI